MASIEVEAGIRLHVQDIGVGPVVLLIPGFGMTHEAWDRQVRVLVDAGKRVVALDQRGHGRSDKPWGGYDIERLAADAVAVLDALGIASCSIVGWSFGGQVGFRIAATQPGRVERLVLVGSNAVRNSRSEQFPFGRDPGPTVAAMLELEERDRFSARRITIAGGFAGEPSSAVLEWMVAQSLMMPSWAAIACYHSMLESDQMALLPTVTMPVLQVIGSLDPVHSAKGARWLQERLADSRLVEIEGCGHYPMFEAPTALDKALLDFLVTAPSAG